MSIGAENVPLQNSFQSSGGIQVYTSKPLDSIKSNSSSGVADGFHIAVEGLRGCVFVVVFRHSTFLLGKLYI